ncbi:MFS transporter [Actinomadura sp. NEAU-AAG7]|uniref:MFS transporter n=1 Tax=Actinomadura sp. NEAU-AAG7 TaxID=2839640 RepID=UPI001BE41B32|nr:MFS transporter [Actinomadura sp. NEAU-AAG7]MBT2207782.1 MFS transporter [Actinomadura sp. NEAU-AAG7]
MSTNLAVHRDGERVGRRTWAALVVLAAGLAIDTGSVAVVNAALPVIGRELDMDDALLQWTITLYAAAFAGFLLFGGRAADVLGRRPVFALGIGVFTVCAAIAAAAPTAEVLVVARAGQGLGAALSGPASLALVTQLFPEGPLRDRALAVYTSVGASSFSGGLVLGGVLTDAFGWRAVFAVLTAIALAVLLAVRSLLPSGTRERQSMDPQGAVLATSGLVAAVYGVGNAATNGWADARTWAPIVVAVVLLIGFLLWERRTADPLLPLTIFHSTPVRRATLAAVAFFTPVLGLLFFAPLYLQGMLGYSPLESGLAIVPMGLIVMVSANVAGRVLARVGQRPLIVGGLLLIAFGVGVLWARTPLGGGYRADVLPGIAVMSVGQGLAFAALTAASLTDVPQARHGVAGALNVTSQQLGGSLGVAALVTVAHAAGSPGTPSGVLDGYHAAYVAGAAVAVLGALVIAVLPYGGTTPSKKKE